MVKKIKEGVKKKDNIRSLGRSEAEDILIENFVGLQHAMTNLSIKFGVLSENISKLLEVLEESAKIVSEKEGSGIGEELTKKIDSLIEQNKLIAKGIVSLESKISQSRTVQNIPRGIPRAFPQPQRFPPQQGASPSPINTRRLPRL